MAPHFNGTLEDVRDRVSHVDGEWQEDSSGKHTFRDKEGGIINFWPSKGTLQFQGKEAAKRKLELLFTNDVPASPMSIKAEATRIAPPSDRKIFIVHGHDTTARDQLELALHRLDVQPFVLMNSASRGQTLIEALEGHIGKDFSSAFGIVLLTPDDMGYAKADGPEKAEPRARQNVILETGMLLSSLTRERMALIVRGHLELPSDLEGIIRLGYNEHIREIIPKLCQNLKAAGFHISSDAISAASC